MRTEKNRGREGDTENGTWRTALRVKLYPHAGVLARNEPADQPQLECFVRKGGRRDLNVTCDTEVLGDQPRVLDNSGPLNVFLVRRLGGLKSSSLESTRPAKQGVFGWRQPTLDKRPSLASSASLPMRNVAQSHWTGTAAACLRWEKLGFSASRCWPARRRCRRRARRVWTRRTGSEAIGGGWSWNE